VAARSRFVSPAADEQWMRLALEEADGAAISGDVPVGSVVVGADGQLLGRGRNRRELDHDPTAHAEIVALRNAAIQSRRWRLEGSTVYVTLEPCAMCAGALVNARVSRVVYAAVDPKAGAVDSVYRVGQDGLLNHCYVVDGGLFAGESVERLQRFFTAQRSRSRK